MIKEGVKAKRKIRNIILAFLAILVWTSILRYGAFPAMEHIVYQYLGFNAIGLLEIKSVTVWDLVKSILVAPAWETLAFIAIPIYVAKRFDEKLVLPVLGLSTIIFGWGHHGNVGMVMQGMMGVIFAWVYIKNNYHFLSAFIVHMAWNAFVSYVSYIERT